MEDEMLIFGYTWEQIQKAQQGKDFRKYVTDVLKKPLATRDDYDLAERHGLEGLRQKGFDSVLDRLKNSAMLAKKEYQDAQDEISFYEVDGCDYRCDYRLADINDPGESTKRPNTGGLK